MPSWSEIEAEAPELAAQARRILDARKHKTIATLRRDGSPRISGIELSFRNGEAWVGSMWRAVKALDLQRDPRFALHSNSPDPLPGGRFPEDQPGDAKLAGRMEEITDPERVREINGSEVGRSHLFRAEIEELVVIRIDGDPPELVIESWHHGEGVTRRTR
jgi:pyridoxamine 5'-phosphate oxidase-like protein